MEHLDYETLNTLRQVMEDDFDLLIDTFIQDSNDRISVLRGVISGTNADPIRRAAHSFKGSSSNIGAIRLMALCSNLEKKAMSNKLEQLDQDLREIEDEFAQVQELLLALD
jgi:HPt (histidine-containing phosphotransfer) domain-containing protein